MTDGQSDACAANGPWDEPLQYCHVCGEPESHADLDVCIICREKMCPCCSVEYFSSLGDPVGAACTVCDDYTFMPKGMTKKRKPKQ